VSHHTKPYSKPSNLGKLTDAWGYAKKYQSTIANTKFLTTDERDAAMCRITIILGIDRHSPQLGLALKAKNELAGLVEAMGIRKAFGWPSPAIPKKAGDSPAPIIDEAQLEPTVKQPILMPAEPLNYSKDITVAILNEKATALLNAISCISIGSAPPNPLQALILQQKQNKISNATDALLQIIDANSQGTCPASTESLKQFMQIEADVLNLLWSSGINYVASDYALAKIARVTCVPLAKKLESAYPFVSDEDKAWITQNKQLFENGPDHFNIDDFLQLQAIIGRWQANNGKNAEAEKAILRINALLHVEGDKNITQHKPMLTQFCGQIRSDPTSVNWPDFEKLLDTLETPRKLMGRVNALLASSGLDSLDANTMAVFKTNIGDSPSQELCATMARHLDYLETKILTGKSEASADNSLPEGRKHGFSGIPLDDYYTLM